MSARVVCDASALIALLVDTGTHGPWVAEALGAAALCAPALVHFETANVLRRQVVRGSVVATQADEAHRILLAMRIDLWPYAALATRSWELRKNLTVYDASYVATAELADATLVTLDRRLSGAPGPHCRILTPPEA